MNKLIYDPEKNGTRLNIVCFISGSGTNYREIVAKNPEHNYFVFTNRPQCSGAEIARKNNHPVIELSHVSYLKEARQKYGSGQVPRNYPARIKYEQDVCSLIENQVGKTPDLVCLAGYDQWTSDWLVEKYYPRMLNVHPGDTTKGYYGLHWVPSAKAIIAGDNVIRATLFIVDKGEDTGPVLLQSFPLNIARTLEQKHLALDFRELLVYLTRDNIKDFNEFRQKADEGQVDTMASICNALQNKLKETGDWEIYPLGIQLIAAGRVSMKGRLVFIDGKSLPFYGYRLDERSGNK